MDHNQQIVDAARNAGLDISIADLPCNGVWKNTPLIGYKNRKKKGYLIKNKDGDKTVCTFGDFISGERQTIVVTDDKSYKPKAKDIRNFINTVSDEQTNRNYEFLSRKATEYFNSLPLSIDEVHPYYQAKKIKPILGVRQNIQKQLVIPLVDIEDNFKIYSYQTISANGEKSFPAKAKTKGMCFPLGDHITDHIGIVEGVATGATVHEQLGILTLCAMSSGQLKAVAIKAKKVFPYATFTIFGDNDHKTERETGINPGIKAAKQAARAICCGYSVPQFTHQQLHDNPKLTDWNDYYSLNASITDEPNNRKPDISS